MERLGSQCAIPGRRVEMYRAFFARMATDNVLDYWERINELPEGVTDILPKYLQRMSLHGFGRASKILRDMMKIPLLDNSIMHGLNRVYTWIARDRSIPLEHISAKESDQRESYSGSCTVMTGEETPTLLDSENIAVITHYIMLGVHLYAWEIEAKKFKATGSASSLRQAAEEVYVAYMRQHTKITFDLARELLSGRTVTILGNYITSEEFFNHPRNQCRVLPGSAEDDRDERMFVLDWPSNVQQKKEFVVKHYHRDSHQLTLTNMMRVDTQMDCVCYCTRPEQYVSTTVTCDVCRTPGTIAALGMKYIHGFGAFCGPCIDAKVESGELLEAQLDYSDIG